MSVLGRKMKLTDLELDTLQCNLRESMGQSTYSTRIGLLLYTCAICTEVARSSTH